MPDYTIVCTDPNHASRSALPGWVTDLGTLTLNPGVPSAPALAGYLCPACAKENSPSGTAIGDPALPDVQQNIIALVDEETGRRVSMGFEYPPASGLIFSLSANAQINWLGLGLKADLITYPYVIRTIDDVDSYSIVDAADAQNVVNSAFYGKETCINQGRVVKVNVLAAADATAAAAAAASWLAGGPP